MIGSTNLVTTARLTTLTTTIRSDSTSSIFNTTSKHSHEYVDGQYSCMSLQLHLDDSHNSNFVFFQNQRRLTCLKLVVTNTVAKARQHACSISDCIVEKLVILEIPGWAVAVIVVAILCSTICIIVCSVSYYRWRFQKTLRDKENGKHSYFIVSVD